jgi:predicted MFS family arabinose efflux permease
MVNLLVIALLAGAATAFCTELIGELVDRWADPRPVKLVLTVPLAAGACWLLGLQPLQLVVPTLAAAFVALAVIRWLNRPVQVQQVVQRRVP